MRRGALARSLIAFSVTLLAAKSASAAWMFAVFLTLVGILGGIAVVLATNDGEPEIGAIRILVDDAESEGWYVGQLRRVTVEADVSFGHIRGDDVGVITLELDFNGTVANRPPPRRYTEQDDDDPDTETLGRWEGTIIFAADLEPGDHGIGTVGAKITVDGETDGLFRDSAATVTASETLPVEVQYPLELQSASGAIGWLDPPNETIWHVECFDQALKVRNRATVHGQVGVGRISHSSATSVPFAAANTNDAAVVTEIVEGSVGHETSQVHGNSVDFKTDWDLSGSDNIRLFLRGDDEWRDDGGTSPSSQDNTCDGGAGNCSLLDGIDAPAVREVDATYVLEIWARNQPPRVASSRQVLVSDTSGFSQIVTTNAAGEFSISAPALGPLVGLDLVVGSDAARFEPKALTGVNVALFDSDVAPTFESFSIVEAEAPSIQGAVTDGLGNPLRADLFVVDGGGEETFLGRFHGAISIPGGLDISTLGYPSATFRIRPLPEFNRGYEEVQLEVVRATDVEDIELGVLVFEEREPFEGPVTFRGTFEVRGPDGVLAFPGAGLSLSIDGVGTVVTGSSGEFEVVVPAGASPRTIGLSGYPNLTSAAGDPLNLPDQTEMEIGFGRNGAPVLDLGVVILHATSGPPAVPVLGPAALGGLALLLASAGIVLARRRLQSVASS